MRLGVRVGKNDVKWERMHALLGTYREREGHADVTAKHVEDGVNLGIWLSRQRAALKAGELDPARQKRLEAMGVQHLGHV